MAQGGKMVDLESGLVAVEATVAVEEEVKKTGTSMSLSPSRGWRIYVALLAIGLCAAAAIFFSVHDQKQDTSTGETGKNNPSFPSNTVEWQSVDELSYVGEGLVLRENQIIIPRRGLYFVYSQVSFEINCHAPLSTSTSTEPETYHLVHEVFRKTTKLQKMVTLLSASRSGCKHQPAEKDSGKRWYGTINMEAIFQLDKDDCLGTTTHPISHVADGQGKTYFGVFAV
ncbi:tumor necrosis factor-like [Engraulis encrasicolus]|uniref:tumor necrosis factor-like n=1 Tax=Engraulis encrasicolus TaxID=184585 RepID=UPI002FD2F96F